MTDTQRASTGRLLATPELQLVVAVISASGVVLAGVLGYLYFSPILGMWLILLAVLTHFKPVYGVAVLFLVISIDTVQTVFERIFVSFSELEFAVVFLTWFAGQSLRARLKDLNLRPILWSLPFLFSVLLSALANIEWFKVLPHLVRQSEIVLAMVLALNVFKGSKTVGTLKWATAAAAVLYLSLGLSQIATLNTLRFVSTFGNTNQFAGYLNLLLPFLAIFCFSEQAKRRQLGWAYLVFLTILTLTMSAARAAFVASLVTLLAVWSLYYGQEKRELLKRPLAAGWQFLRTNSRLIGLHLIGCLLIGLAAVKLELLPDNLEQKVQPLILRLRPEHFHQSFELRGSFWQIGLAIWSNHPFLGVGPGRYPDIHPDYWSIVENPVREHLEMKWRETKRNPARREIWIQRRLELLQGVSKAHVHNLFLQQAVDFGLLGALGFVLFGFFVLRALLQRRPRSVLALAGIGLVVGFLIHNLVDVTFPSLALETGLLSGASLGAAGGHNGPKSFDEGLEDH